MILEITELVESPELLIGKGIALKTRSMHVIHTEQNVIT